jgi:hypothetical protein
MQKMDLSLYLNKFTENKIVCKFFMKIRAGFATKLSPLATKNYLAIGLIKKLTEPAPVFSKTAFSTLRFPKSEELKKQWEYKEIPLYFSILP